MTGYRETEQVLLLAAQRIEELTGVKTAVYAFSLSARRQDDPAGDMPEEVKIATIVAKTLKIPYREMITGGRERILADARSITSYLIRQIHPDITYIRLARFFKKDHSTIVYDVRKCETLVKNDKRFREKFLACCEAIQRITLSDAIEADI